MVYVALIFISLKKKINKNKTQNASHSKKIFVRQANLLEMIL